MGGGKNWFDGLLVLGDKPENCQLMLSLSDEELLRSQTIMLRVVPAETGNLNGGAD